MGVMKSVLSVLFLLSGCASPGSWVRCPDARILALPSGASLNAEIYAHCEPRRIAELLLQRSDSHSAASEDLSGLWNLEVGVFVPWQHLESVLTRGILNLHQANTTGGNFTAQEREQVEAQLLGIHLEESYHSPGTALISDRVRPKYGIVLPLTPTAITIRPRQLCKYGEVLLILKEEVKRRTTYTLGDTMLLSMRKLESPVLRRLSRFDWTSRGYYPFVEAQIWGPIDPSDIREIRLPLDRDFEGKGDPVRVAVSRSGIPVSRFQAPRSGCGDLSAEASRAGFEVGSP